MATPSLDAWVTCPRPNPQARLRLFCFPYAGGGASLFRTWADDLPPAVEVCPIQLPGRENRFIEPRYTHVAPLIAALGEALHPYLDKPCALFGHSMGALIAFELARYLRQRDGFIPERLFVAAHRAPQLPYRRPPLHPLPDPAFTAALRRLNGTPPGVLEHVELWELMLPLLRADFTLAETYTYTPDEPLTCPISAFGGMGDHEVDWEDIAAWSEQTRGSFTLRMLTGDHFFLHSARTLLLPAISQDLAAAVGEGCAFDLQAGTTRRNSEK
jgi:medium-chain acyl-[acyl-carrier-protein] hydrolase